MNQLERKLIFDWLGKNISEEDFISAFPIDIKNNPDYLISELDLAVQTSKNDDISLLAEVICWRLEANLELIDALHKLLLNSNHLFHQYILLKLQELANPKSIFFIEKALETKFDYIPYTGSDTGSIAKWFSWTLASIGTKEAINLIQKYSHSEDKEISEEMLYRLRRLKEGL